MAERASLKRQNTLVNRVPAFLALFLATACVGEDPKDQTVTIKTVTAPIVWQTPIFDQNVSRFGLSTDAPQMLLVSFEQSGLKLFDIDGAEVTPKFGSFFPTGLSGGVISKFDDTSLRLFFGSEDKADRISIFAYGNGLEAPTRLQLEPEISGGIAGVCSAPSDTDGSIAKLGYWTKLDNATLVLGEVRTSTDNKLTFIETERLHHEKYITSCALDGDTAVTGGGFGLQFNTKDSEAQSFDIPGVPVEMSYLESEDLNLVAMTFSGGSVYVASDDGKMGGVSFKAGISSKVPDEVSSVSLSSVGSVGGLPTGFLAAQSKTPTGTQIIYTDLQNLKNQLAEE